MPWSGRRTWWGGTIGGRVGVGSSGDRAIGEGGSVGSGTGPVGRAAGWRTNGAGVGVCGTGMGVGEGSGVAVGRGSVGDDSAGAPDAGGSAGGGSVGSSVG